MKTMQLHNTIATELNQEESNQIKASFFIELNNLCISKTRLISFLKLLTAKNSFSTIELQLNDLQEDLKQQAKQLENITMLTKGDAPADLPQVNESGLFESKMLNDGKVFTIKTKLSLLLYVVMAERKEFAALKKLKALAQMLNYTQCFAILNQPEKLMIDSGKLVDKVAVGLPKIAV